VFSVAAIGAGIALDVWRMVIGTASGMSSDEEAGQWQPQVLASRPPGFGFFTP
jgi:hypothetical protein